MLSGNKIICLAISDENAGSDVAGLTCTAKLSECGKFYIVNGTKKWITNGNFADYFVTAVRTGEAGILGISMLLIERSEGILFIINRLNNKANKNELFCSGRNSFRNVHERKSASGESVGSVKPRFRNYNVQFQP